MAIDVSPYLEERIHREIKRGRFTDANEVTLEAMRLLDERESRLNGLRAKIQIGLDELDRGEGDVWTPALIDRLSREVDEMQRRVVGLETSVETVRNLPW